MYFGYLLKKYFKNFLIILMALVIFFVIVDIVNNYNKLVLKSTNLQILYIYYTYIYAADIIYPIALVFSFLLTIYYLLKFNELVSFYSLRFNVKKLLKPFVFFSFLVYLFFLLLDTTKMAYVKEYADALLKNKQYNTENLFMKYNDNIIYIKKIVPILNESYDIRVFQLKNGKVKKIIYAKKAIFKNDIWYAKDAEIVIITNKNMIKNKSNIFFLKNFKPKIVSNLKKIESISLYDAFIAFKVFKNIDLNLISSIVIYKIVTPLVMIVLMVIFFINAPIHQRISNISFFFSKTIFVTIIVWGIELLLQKFSKQGVISPYSIILPFILILLYALYKLYKEK